MNKLQQLTILMTMVVMLSGCQPAPLDSTSTPSPSPVSETTGSEPPAPNIETEIAYDPETSQALTPTQNALNSVGEYKNYSVDVFAAEGDQKRVLFFHAAWCPTCKAADAEISANLAEIPDGVIIYKTDYDTQTELKKKYGITYQHTFVQVDAQGEAITKWNGGGLTQLRQNIK